MVRGPNRPPIFWEVVYIKKTFKLTFLANFADADKMLLQS